MQNKTLLFTVTRHDCDWQYFCAGGKGGQNQNKVASACRCIHRASGAVGESREHRDQWANRKAAFRRMATTAKFEAWHELESSRRLGLATTIAERVEAAMDPINLKVEFF